MNPVPTPPPTRAPRAPKPADRYGWWWGTGRRKTAVARIRMKPAKDGGGSITIERRDKKVKKLNEYFTEERDRTDANSPLKISGVEGKMQIVAKLHGGGQMGQAQALRLAIARALRDYDPSLEAQLRDAGMLTRDAREVERKKYGQAGARRRFQFSKR